MRISRVTFEEIPSRSRKKIAREGKWESVFREAEASADSENPVLLIKHKTEEETKKNYSSLLSAKSKNGWKDLIKATKRGNNIFIYYAPVGK